MPFKDILLHLESYPDRVSDRAIDGATALAAALGKNVTAVSPR
ncbi:MAG: universal stress protein, partial [Phenylobacterium sp.]|nr:universal stress protein [Phenylobacterium sp.]